VTVARLVTHSEIQVAAPAIVVWPHILQPNGWKLGLHPVRVEGDLDQVGEVREASAGPAVLRVETVALKAPVRKVVRLTTGSDLDPAWAAWHLTDAGGVTTVAYDVYGDVETGTDDAAAFVSANQQRFDAELVSLKQLVEAGTTTA
jgi:LEA14-like dessication related protein